MNRKVIQWSIFAKGWAFIIVSTITYFAIESFLKAPGLEIALALAIGMVLSAQVEQNYIKARILSPWKAGFVDSLLFALKETLYLLGAYLTPLFLSFAYTKGWFNDIGVIIGVIAWSFAVMKNIKSHTEEQR